MKLAATALLSATAMALIAPMASAQSYAECEQNRQDRQVTGAIIGGLLGAVIGNELADDDDDHHAHRRHHRRYDRYDRRYNRYDRRHDRHHRRHHRRHHDDNDETVATLAGAGVGALIGAGIAGGDDCHTARRDRRYDDRRYEPSRYDDRYDYDDRYRASDRGYSDGYDTRSNGALLGGRHGSSSSQNYQARTYQAGHNWSCEYRTSPQYNEYNEVRYVEVYMCEGHDGIWRPADTYGN